MEPQTEGSFIKKLIGSFRKKEAPQAETKPASAETPEDPGVKFMRQHFYGREIPDPENPQEMLRITEYRNGEFATEHRDQTPAKRLSSSEVAINNPNLFTTQYKEADWLVTAADTKGIVTIYNNNPESPRFLQVPATELSFPSKDQNAGEFMRPV